MARTKAEVEAEHAQYTECVRAAIAALESRDVETALRHAVAAWDFVDGMMQYERRYNKAEFVSIAAIDIVLDIAPFVFDLASLNRLEALLKSQRAIVRNTTTAFRERLSVARETVRHVALIWERMANADGHVAIDEWRRLHCDRHIWESVTRLWLSVGLIESSGDTLRWATRMNGITTAKCSACGVLARGPKDRLLDDAKCPSCGGRVPFVMISEIP